MKIEEGQVKISLWPSRNRGDYAWVPGDAMTNAVLDVEHVDEVSSECAQSTKIILCFESIEEMQQKLPEIKAKILQVIENKSLRHVPNRLDLSYSSSSRFR